MTGAAEVQDRLATFKQAMEQLSAIGNIRVLVTGEMVSTAMAPRAGFELATIRLTVGCSTAELPRNKRYTSSRAAAYNKASSACIGRNGGLHRPRNAGRKAWFGKALPVRIATRKRRSRITFHAECHPATRHSFDAKWTHLPLSFRAPGSRR